MVEKKDETLVITPDKISSTISDTDKIRPPPSKKRKR